MSPPTVPKIIGGKIDTGSISVDFNTRFITSVNISAPTIKSQRKYYPLFESLLDQVEYRVFIQFPHSMGKKFSCFEFLNIIINNHLITPLQSMDRKRHLIQKLLPDKVFWSSLMFFHP